jgi:hypothetical protein
MGFWVNAAGFEESEREARRSDSAGSGGGKRDVEGGEVRTESREWLWRLVSMSRMDGGCWSRRTMKEHIDV